MGAVLYNVLTRRALEPFPHAMRVGPEHRFHLLALALPFLAFPGLWVLPWNPIYPGIVAMVLGALATVVCRRDLGTNVLVGGAIFLAYYTVFLLGLEAISPGYVERVWNFAALSGVRLGGLPLEELLFAFAFGAYWASVYEHFTWHRSVRAREAGPDGAAVADGPAASS